MNNTTAASSSGQTSDIIIIALSIASSSGFFANLFLLALILITRSTISGDFKWFVFNLSFLDALYCIATASYLYTLNHPEFPMGAACSFLGFLFTYTPCGVILALVPVTFNRQIAIFFPHLYTSFFSSKKSLVFICILFDAIPMIPLFIGMQWGYYGKPPQFNYCAFWPNQLPPPIGGGYRRFAQIMYYSVFVVYAYVLFVNVSVYVKLKRHVQQSTTVDVKETKEIVRATLIQAVTPLLLQTPSLIENIVTWAFVTVPSWLVNVTYSLFSFNSVLNVCIVFIMLKPYRKALKALFNGIFNTANNQVQTLSGAH